ncbi:MAG: TRAP-type C4-dicarboxylate transport system, small permease component [Ignavibacteriae bacterium]|nr:MAG: TRAP-type C4-dicarboxylate transport system, small permease component [Ignavibacteriota bacterium]
MTFLSRISKYIAYGEKAILILILSMMVLLSSLQVILRNIFSTGILWLDPLLRHLVLWIAFLGASIATQNDKHINIDILSRFLPTKHKHITKFITHIFSAIVVTLLFIASIKFLADEMDAQTTIFTISNLEIKSYHMQMIIPVGFGLMFLRFLISAINNFLLFYKTGKT